jgi:hypothetical protein
MAEETQTTVETEVTEQVDTQTEVETPQEKTYTEAELQKIIKDRVAREQKAKDKAVEEAARLAKMNEDEKAKYELEKLKEELADLKRKDAQYGLSKEASKMLAEHDIQADDGLLAFVVKDDAEATKAAVDSFVALIDAKVAEGVKKALSGTAPKMNIAGNTAMTKEQFNKLPYKERAAFYEKDPNILEKLK